MSRKYSLKNRVLLMSLLATLLAACSGSGVKTPDVVIAIPVAKQFDTNSESNPLLTTSENKERLVSQTTRADGGKVDVYGQYRDPFGWGPPYYSQEDIFVYQTSDGKLYEFTNLNHALVPDHFDGNKKVNTRQMMQATDNGGKLFACCTEISATSGSAFAMEKGGYYGAWIAPNGEVNLFTGGIAARPERMHTSGKATFEVWGIRVKNQQVVGSTYEVGKEENTSYLTVNFNTGKVGGTILGNDDFGDAIVLQDVDVNRNMFSGTAQSGQNIGRVEGSFYTGTQNRSRFEGDKIGGVVKFENQASLDAAFGGSRIRENERDTSRDLNHLK